MVEAVAALVVIGVITAIACVKRKRPMDDERIAAMERRIVALEAEIRAMERVRKHDLKSLAEKLAA